MPLLTERDTCETGSYKHVAPLEQEPSITNDDAFSGKAMTRLIATLILFSMAPADWQHKDAQLHLD